MMSNKPTELHDLYPGFQCRVATNISGTHVLEVMDHKPIEVLRNGLGFWNVSELPLFDRGEAIAIWPVDRRDFGADIWTGTKVDKVRIANLLRRIFQTDIKLIDPFTGETL